MPDGGPAARRACVEMALRHLGDVTRLLEGAQKDLTYRDKLGRDLFSALRMAQAAEGDAKKALERMTRFARVKPGLVRG